LTLAETFYLISALSLFAFAIVAIQTFIQFRRTLTQIEQTFKSLNQHIDPLCTSLNEAAGELRILSITLNEKVEQTDAVIQTARMSAETLLTASSLLKETVLPVVTNIGGFSAGLKTFSHFLGKTWKKS